MTDDSKSQPHSQSILEIRKPVVKLCSSAPFQIDATVGSTVWGCVERQSSTDWWFGLRFTLVVLSLLVCSEPGFAQQWAASRSQQVNGGRYAAAGFRPGAYQQQEDQLETLPHPEDFVAEPETNSQIVQTEPHVKYFDSRRYPGEDGYFVEDCDVPVSEGFVRPGLINGGPVRDRIRNRPGLRSRFGNDGYRYRPILGGIRRGLFGDGYHESRLLGEPRIDDQSLRSENFFDSGRHYQTNRPVRDFIFPIFPLFRQRWPNNPGLERPRSVWLNPFAIQQGLGNLIFRGNYPADTGALGFPYSMVPSHLVDRVPRPFFDLSRNQSQGRHIGRGNPFRDSSWSNRPVHISWFTGVMFTGDLNSQVSSSNGLYNGFRAGWDFDHYWGTEFRYGFGSHSLQNRQGEVDIRTADISILYYPWGDSRWRPYTSMGVGFGTFDFINANGNSVDEATFQLPLGVGLKYSVKPWWAARIEAVNIFSFESGDVDFMNNVLLSGSIEIHFGGRRRMYFPFDEGPSAY